MKMKAFVCVGVCVGAPFARKIATKELPFPNVLTELENIIYYFFNYNTIRAYLYGRLKLTGLLVSSSNL